MNKKKLYKIVFIILLLFIVMKIITLIIINRTISTLEKFFNSDNWYYNVSIKNESQKSIVEEYYNSNILARKSNNNDEIEYFKFKKNEKIIVNNKTKKYYKYLNEYKFNKIGTNLPDYIFEVYKRKLSSLFETIYIIPIKFNNIRAYKIKTFSNEIIIDKQTFLPLCFIKKYVNSDDNTKSDIVFTYEFKLNVVNDEDVKIPDLTEYELLN